MSIEYPNRMIIRRMQPEDAQVFADEERAQGWNTEAAKFEMRLKDQSEGRCISLVAEMDGHPAGYINVYPDSPWGSFGGKGLPEIVDFCVLQKYQRKGIGSRLMDEAEHIAGEYADTVYLGVGLHNGYGAAQRMYAKRGYIPDGSGAWYNEKICTPYDRIYTNDDDLVLYLSKKLPARKKAGHSSGLMIRKMELSDYDRVYALWMSCKNMGFNNLDDSREGIEKYLKRNPETCFVAEKGENLIGVILAGHDGRRGFIHHMAVAESSRRQGIAHSLLVQALSALKAEGIHKVALLVFKRNEAGNAFWESQGFAARDDVTYRNKALTELVRIDT